MTTQEDILEKISYYKEEAKIAMPNGSFELHKTDEEGIYFTVSVALSQINTDELQDITAATAFCPVEETIHNGVYLGKFFMEYMTEEKFVVMINTPSDTLYEQHRKLMAQVKAEW